MSGNSQCTWGSGKTLPLCHIGLTTVSVMLVSVCYGFEIEKSYVTFVCVPSAKEIDHLQPWPK